MPEKISNSIVKLFFKVWFYAVRKSFNKSNKIKIKLRFLALQNITLLVFILKNYVIWSF